MRKDIKEALNEKMSVELPDALKSENIVKELKRTGEITELGSKKRKSFNAKRLVPAAASLLLTVGLLGVYLANPLGGIKLKSPAEDKQAVTVCDSYDEVYAKFDRIKNEQKKKSIKDFFNFDKVSAPLEGIETEDKNYGETNTQESGVGEGDVIKTDGEYIYALTDYGRSFHIVDCRGGKTKPLSSVFFNDGNGLGNEGINEMYIYGDYAVLVGEKFGKDADRCYTPYGSNSWTVVKIYDISDKAAPKKINEFCYAGSPSSSRMIGSILYCVSAYSVNINGDLKEYCIPEIEKDGEFKKIPANCISVIEDTVTPSYIIVSAYDTEKGGEPSVKAVLGSCQNIYATAENLFVAEMPQMKNECTKIYKFAYTESGVEFKAAGEVPGQLRDRFSMGSQDEYPALRQ